MAYNGWTNYETWNVNLWIDNDYPLYQRKVALLRHLEEVTADDVERFFHDELDGTTPDLETLREQGEAVDPIDFDEIAEHWELERQELAGCL